MEEEDELDSGVCNCCLNEGPVRSMIERTSSGDVCSQLMLLCFGLDVMVTNIGDHKRVICRTCERQLRDSLHFRQQIERSLHVLEEEMKATGLNEDMADLTTKINEEEESVIPKDGPEGSLIVNLNQNDHEEYYLVICESDVDIEESVLPNYDWKCQNMLTLLEYSKIYPFHYNSGKYKCFYCRHDFLGVSQMQSHTKEHSVAVQKEIIMKYLLSNERDYYIKVDVSNLECRVCNNKLSNLQSLKVHLQEAHSKEINAAYNDDIVPFKLSGATIDCQLCENTFDEMASLILHMNVHFNNYTCEICGAPFITEQSLQAHSEAHKTVNFQCNQCCRKFPTAKECYFHINTVHNTHLNLKCPKCPQHLKSTYELMKHIESVHGDLPRTYKCDICTKEFALQSMLNLHIKQARHMIEHTDRTELRCEVCQKPYVLRSMLLEHMRTHRMSELATKQKYNPVTFDVDRERRIMTYKYDWKCKNTLTLLKYSEIYPFHYHYQSSKFQCFICRCAFIDVSEMRSHITAGHSIIQLNESVIDFWLARKQDYSINVDVSNLECRLCSDNLPNLQSLKVHLKEVHSKDIDPTFNDNIVPFKLSGEAYDCQLCEKSFDKMILLIRHMNFHFSNYTCENYSVPFITELSLQAHSTKKKETTFQAHSKTQKTSKFQCDLCNRIFASAKNLTYHINCVHCGVPRRTLKCPKCPERLNNGYALMKHGVSVHNEARRIYKCDICSKELSYKSALYIHVKLVHDNIKNYDCPECPAKFCFLSGLKKHMTKHTGEKNFECDICCKAFARKMSLRTHIIRHTRSHNDRKFACDVCGNSFFDKSTLKRHSKNVHRLL